RRLMTGDRYLQVRFHTHSSLIWRATNRTCLEFDKLNRQVVKLVQAGNTPKMYIKAIADLEDFMNETIAKQKVTPKKMNATNARGLNAVKQRIRKNNKDYASLIEEYRNDKEGFMESDEEEEEEEV